MFHHKLADIVALPHSEPVSALSGLPSFFTITRAGIVSTEFSYAREEEIYGECEPAEYVYQVISGAVRTYKLLNDGRRQIDAFHLHGDIFGLDSGDVHRLTAEAIVDTNVRITKRRALVAAARVDVLTACDLWKITADDLRRAQDHMLLLGRMNAITEAEVRALFPRMPAEVFDLWLGPAYAESGWPHFAETYILHSPSWRAHLVGRLPSFWAGVTWSLRHEVLRNIVWDEGADQKVAVLAEHWAKYKHGGEWKLTPNSPVRLQSVDAHLQQHNALPGRLVCLNANDRWYLLDGHHRIAAARTAPLAEKVSLQVWLGENAA